MDTVKDDDQWDIVIKPTTKGFNLKLKEVWAYRDLLYMYIKRDFIATYKQTILGPAWFFIQPIFTTLIMMLVFTGIAQISTDGLPPVLFYMSGNVLWGYFSDCLTRSSTTFTANANVFSRVYFPRLVVPVSGLISAMIRFFIQLVMFFGFFLYYYFFSDYTFSMNAHALLFPLLIFILAGVGFGAGIIISSVTIKYRDLAILFSFAVGLMMYITPVAYPISAIPESYSEYAWIIQLNPLSSVVETFRYGFMGEGTFSWIALAYSFAFTIVISMIGILTFNKVERRFVDII